MDNRNDFLSNKAYLYQNSNKTFSVFMNLKAPEKNQFYECVAGKVKFYIYDFSNGKGDRAIHAAFNLDIPDIYSLYEFAKAGHMPEPIWKSKIIGSAPQRGGPFNGLCPSYKLQISHSDGGQGNNGRKNPPAWFITIKNGYANALPGKVRGTYYEQSNSFRQTAEGKIMLTNSDFLYMMTNIMNGLDAFALFYKTNIFPKLLAQFQKENEERRNQRNQTGYGNNNQNNQNFSASPYNGNNGNNGGNNVNYDTQIPDAYDTNMPF